MSADILLLRHRPGETRIARLDGAGHLVDFALYRRGHDSLTGAIMLARVVRVAPAMEAAFVDIGERRDGFLGLPEARPAAPGGPETPGDAISDHVHEGEALIVQVLADARDGKGAKLTRHIKLAGEQLVYAPLAAGARVSARIRDKAERARLRAIAETLTAKPDGGRVVVRSAAEGAEGPALAAELQTLKARWAEMAATAGAATPPRRLNTTASPLSVYLEQTGRRGIARIVSDGAPEAGVEAHPQRPDIFRAFGVDDDVAALLNPQVGLPGGGSLIIEETAALVAIDINAGGAGEGGSGKGNALALNTNLEAVKEAARQVRLRNLGGLIVLDPMPLRTRADEQKVLAALRKALAGDPLRPRLHGLTSAGLIEITRPRRRPPLSHLMLEPCITCGLGRAPRALTIGLEALDRVLAEVAARPGLIPALAVSPRVATALKTEAAGALDELEARLGQPLELIVDATLAPGQFRVDAAQR